MHIDLISATKSRTKEIHGTDNGKRTGCGINLVKAVGQYTSIGEMTDIAQITCEKCKTVLAKRIIRESNKEMQRILKEDQKALKREAREESAAVKQQAAAAAKTKNVTIPKAPSPAQGTASGEYVPPTMRPKQQEIESPVPTPLVNEIPTVPTSIPSPMPQDDVLAQFAIPSVPAAPQFSDEIPEVPSVIPSPMPQDDVLAQFAIPSVPAAPQLSDEIPEAPSAIPSPMPQDDVDDVLAQFAIPSVPAAPQLSEEIPEVPSVIPSPMPQDDVLAQFAIPSVPAQTDDVISDILDTMPADLVDDQPDGLGTISFSDPTPADNGVFNNIANSLFGGETISEIPEIPEIPTVPEAPAGAISVSFSAPEEIHDIIDTTPVSEDDYDPFRKMKAPVLEVPTPASTPAASDLPVLDIPEVPTAPQNIPVLDVPEAPATPAYPSQAAFTAQQQVPTLNVPEAPAAPVYPGQTPIVPTLDVPPVPAAPAYPTQAQAGYPQAAPVPTLEVPTAPAAPVYPQQPVYAQTPVQPVPTLNVPIAPAAPVYPQQMGYPQQGSFLNRPAPAPIIPPQPAAPQKVAGPTPLFIGYSADGRQVFQTYDANGQPIPITEPVYSTPPQEASAPVLTGAFANGVQPGATQIMDIEELMSAMGIEDKKPVASDEKVINYTEYHIPQKKKKKPAAPPKSAQPDDAPKMPMSAAEAKRQKKLDKINQEFEKKLKDRGIDPETGAFVGKGTKKK